MEVLLNIWWKSLHRKSRYCQNHQNGVTSCFPKMVINILNHQNIGCKLLPNEEKIWKFETWPFTHYQTRSGILKHCELHCKYKLLLIKHILCLWQYILLRLTLTHIKMFSFNYAHFSSISLISEAEYVNFSIFKLQTVFIGRVFPLKTDFWEWSRRFFSAMLSS